MSFYDPWAYSQKCHFMTHVHTHRNVFLLPMCLITEISFDGQQAYRNFILWPLGLLTEMSFYGSWAYSQKCYFITHGLTHRNVIHLPSSSIYYFSLRSCSQKATQKNMHYLKKMQPSPTKIPQTFIEFAYDSKFIACVTLSFSIASLFWVWHYITA